MDLNKAIIDLYKQRSLVNKQSKNPNGKIAMEQDKPSSQLEIVPNLKPETTFDQLHGVEYVQSEILLIIARFKRAIDGQADKSNLPILICGSKGLGKTSLVEAAANHAQLNLVPINLVQMVRLTRNHFQEALEHLVRHSIAHQPSIVLIDDLDQISEKEEFKYPICDAIERLSDKNLKTLVICTTASTFQDVSYISFPYTIKLKRPTLEARFKILEGLRQSNKNLSNLTDDNLNHLATNTPSFTALNLRNMLDIAETKSNLMPTIEQCEKAIEVVKQSFKRGTYLIGEKPQVTWNDIGGMSHVRQAFADILKQIRSGNCKFAGIALYGPAGCGKTMVAQAMANEAGFNFISIQPAELKDKYLGETEKNIRQVFREAREYEPCMIYFEEFEGLCGTRGNKDNVTSAIQTLLSEMDGFESRGQSLILASTNRLEDIDPAMKRPGRLTEHIYVGLPGPRARKDILNVTTKRLGLKLADDIDLDELANKTKHFNGAQLSLLVDKARARAAEKQSDEKDSHTNDNASNETEVITLGRSHFKYAMKKIRSNKEKFEKTRAVKRIRIE